MASAAERDATDGVNAANQLIEILARVEREASWATKSVDASTRCTTAEARVPSLPTSVFRLQLTMDSSIETLQEVLQDESSLRLCDPAVEELIVLDGSTQSRRTTVYMAYKRPSVFVAARDFVVQSTQETMLLSEWTRRCGSSPASASPTSRVLVQSSASVVHTKAPVGWRGDHYVRGTVHLFGCVAIETPPTSGGRTKRLTVSNYCCVDPNGAIPQWVVKAVIGQQAQKVATLRAICESRYEVSISARHAEHAATSTSGLGVLNTPAAPSSHETQTVSPPTARTAALAQDSFVNNEEYAEDADDLSDDSFHTARSCGSQSVLTFAGDTEHVGPACSSECVRRALTFASGASSPVQAAHRDREEYDESASDQFGVATSPRRVVTQASLGFSPAPRAPPPSASSLTALQRETLRRLSSLARASGWTLREEGTGGATVEQLSRLPFLFSSLLRNRQWPVAVRACCLVHCPLRVVARVLGDTDAADSWDPALFPVLQAVSGTATGERTRHYRFDRPRSATPWATTLTVATCPLVSPSEGGQLGFFTAGMNGACHVWGGFRTGHEAFPSDPHKVHRDAHTLCFGLVAVAVPSDASLVRVSHYALVDFSGVGPVEVNYRFHKSMLKQLVANMKARLTALTSLLTSRQCSLSLRSSPGSAVAAVTTQPTLWALVDTVRDVEQASTYEPHRLLPTEAGSREVQVRSVPFLQSSRVGRAYLFTVVVKCDLMRVNTFLGGPGGEVPVLPPLQTFDMHVSSLRQLPSPPGAAIILVEHTCECAAVGGLSFCFMEVSGVLAENDRRVFVLSRVNCSTPGRDLATLHCDGYVAEAVAAADGLSSDTLVRLQHVIATDVCESCQEAMVANPTVNAFVTEQVDQLRRLVGALELPDTP